MNRYPASQLTYKMTYNMIKELKNNLKIRCADLRGNWTTLSIHSGAAQSNKGLSDTAYLYNVIRSLFLAIDNMSVMLSGIQI